jgi:hypothetical protein
MEGTHQDSIELQIKEWRILSAIYEMEEKQNTRNDRNKTISPSFTASFYKFIKATTKAIFLIYLPNGKYIMHNSNNGQYRV